jgi:hypothetical protein
MEVFMSHEARATGSRPSHNNTHGWGGPSGPSGKDLKKVVGGAFMVVGTIFTLYGAGSGLSALIRVSLDNFGTVCIVSLINFIFWSCFLTPIGGLLANGICAAGGILLFGGLPAIPGAAIAAGGAYMYLS